MNAPAKMAIALGAVVVAAAVVAATLIHPPGPNDFFRCIHHPVVGRTGLPRPVAWPRHLQWQVLSGHE